MDFLLSEVSMKKYRIKEVQPGQFIIEQKCLWWWEDVSTPTRVLPGYQPVQRITSVGEARQRIKAWQERESFVPVIHAP
jgi:hypothetical protein